MTETRRAPSLWLAVPALLVLAACGGSSSPGGPSNGGGNPTPSSSPVATNTITITGNSVSPRDIVIAVGSTVTFVNQDGRSHQMSSDPHPVHTDCPQLNTASVGSGQSAVSQPMPTAKVCGFHDHLDPENRGLQGTVTIR